MVRKIKGSKHHGVKDPEKQKEMREEKIKMKINNRPGKDDFQEVPRKMKELMNQNINTKRKRKRGDKDLLDSAKHFKEESWMPGMDKPLKPIPRFKQNPGEGKKEFFYRMHTTIQTLKQQRNYENKFKVEMKTDETGTTSLVAGQPDHIDPILAEKRRKRLARKGVIVKSADEKRAAKRAREKKRKNKKNRSNEDETLDFTDFKDNPDFGEVVHQPPELNFKSKRLDADKPGKNDLLLKKKLNSDNGGGGGVQKNQPKKAKPSMAKQVMMEKERQRVVEAYRALKADKMSSSIT